ncbi:MAG TPA: methyltransferase domain-containing protein [Candidatus Saccharimonadales bacterium]
MTVRAERSIWHRRARRSMVTGRSSDWYNQLFDISPDERILDIGSGKSSHAQKNVVRLDYLYSGHTPTSGNNVAALFQELPFADQTFDRVIASQSLIKVKKGAVQAIAEILRVTRQEGYLEAYPVGVGSRQTARDIEISQNIERKQHVKRIERLGVPITGGAAAGLVGYFASEVVVHGMPIWGSALIGLASGMSTAYVGLNGYSFGLSIQRPELADSEARIGLVRDIVQAYDITAAH